MKHVIQIWLTIGLAFSCLVSHAAPTSVSMDTCVVASEVIVRKVIASEIGPAPRVDDVAQETLSIHLSCDGPLTTITVVDPLTGKRLERRIDLENRPPEVAGRVLGLAASELVLASWAELTLMGSAAISSPDLVASAPKSKAVAMLRLHQKTRREHSLGAFLGTRLFSAGSTYGGVGVDGVFVLDWPFSIAMDTWIGRDHSEMELGELSTSLVSLGPRFQIEHRIDRLELFAGLGARLGVSRVLGTAKSTSLEAVGHRFTKAWGGPFASFATRIRATPRWDLRLGAETGYTALGVQATVGGLQSPLIKGWWLGLRVGLGHSF